MSTRPMGVEIRNRVPKVAVAQALRFEFHLGPVAIGRLLNATPQDISRYTVLESFKGIPWELRQRQADAIAEAAKLLNRHNDK